MTTQEVNEAFDKIVREHNGQFWEVEDPSNPDQCFDLAFGYIDILKIPRPTIRHQYAVQIYKNPLDITLDYFEFIPNTPNGVPHKGDVVVFDGPVGHVSVASGKGDINSFESFDQNWGNPKSCRLVTHDYTTVLGWLRPRITGAPPPITPPANADGERALKIVEEIKTEFSHSSLEGAARAAQSAERDITPVRNKLKTAKEKAQEIANL